MIPRRNKNKIPTMPGDWELIALTFGVGKDDFLYVALAYKRHAENETPEMDQFVTWNGNASVPVEPNVGEGHYMLRGRKTEEKWLDYVWEDFEARSRKLYRMVPEWIDLEAKNEARKTA